MHSSRIGAVHFAQGLALNETAPFDNLKRTADDGALVIQMRYMMLRYDYLSIARGALIAACAVHSLLG